MITPKEVLQHIDKMDTAVSILKQTVDRRVYDPVVDNAIESVVLALLIFRSAAEGE